MPEQSFTVMIGTALNGRGGMSSVVAAYRAAGLFERVPVRYIESHREVSFLGKAWLVICGLASLFAMLLRRQVRLAHVHVASGVSFWRKLLFVRLVKLFSRPVILHLHGGEFLEFFRGCPKWQQSLLRSTFEGADRVIVLSSTWCDQIGEISEHLRIVVLPNPVAVPADVTLRDGREFRVLFLGRLERAKGVFDLIEAFALLKRERADAVLTLGGVGDFVAVRQKLAGLEIEESVELPGWVIGAAKDALLRTADAFALPSYAEGLPVSMLEAMAYGIPVIVSRVGSVPEVITDGEQGLLTDVGDIQGMVGALRKLADSLEERRRLGQAGNHLVKSQYAVDQVCTQLEQIYGELMTDEEESCSA